MMFPMFQAFGTVAIFSESVVIDPMCAILSTTACLLMTKNSVLLSLMLRK